jgi:outer membrane receptor protein involved in Fe transport
MKSTYIFFLLIVFAQAQVAAQTPSKPDGLISGQVLDSISKTPLEYATVSFIPEGHSKAENGAVTDSRGQFNVRLKSSGYFNILFESLGYQSDTVKHIFLDRKTGVPDLAKILLIKKETSLQSVVITAPSKLVENKLDKMVFNAEKDLTSQGGVATDILKKVPMVSVDVDGNVELAGSSSIKFLINGKPSTAFGSNIADVLQSIPASQIKSIEVVTNPGAKYDAEGLGGIINIILKHSSVRGINGNISLSAGTRTENGSFNLNARRGNFGIHAYAGAHTRLSSETPSSSRRTSTDTVNKTTGLLEQDRSGSSSRHGMQGGIGFDWTVQKKNNFSGWLNYGQYGSVSDGSGNQTQTTTALTGGAPFDQLQILNQSHHGYSSHNIDASLNYKRTFKKKDQDLEIELRTSSDHSDITSNNRQFILPQDSLYFGRDNTSKGGERESEIQVDYSQPLGEKSNLSTGGKINFRDIDNHSDVLSLDPETNIFGYDATLSNRLTYHQRIYALYAEISLPVFSLFDMRVGSRYERTELDPYFSNAQTQVAEPGYNTWVPSAFFMRKINDAQNIRFSYSKRIRRPDYYDLNPFINTSDPKNISTGNPYLKPQIGNRFELSYSYDLNSAGYLMATAFYRTSKDDIQPYIVYYPELVIGDTTYTGVNMSTRQNIGLEKDAGLSLYGHIHVTEQFDVRSNVFLFHRHTINGLDAGPDATSFNYRLNMNLSYRFGKSFAGEFFGNFNSPRNELHGRYPSFTSYSFAFRKQFWNKKGSIALTASNPFNNYVNQRTELYGSDFTMSSLRKIPYRSFGINFTWKFGKLDFKNSKEDAPDVNSVPTGTDS